VKASTIRRDTLAVVRRPAEATLRVASTIPVSFVDGPGNRFTIFLQGCNFDCFNCHNPTLIGPSNEAASRSVADLVEEIRRHAPFLSGVTVSGGEATLQLDGVVALFRAIKADPELAHLTTYLDSNGTLDDAGWWRLAPVMDAAMIDIKAIDDATHRLITGQGNTEVLASVRTLHMLGRLEEIRLLVIEGLTDSETELTAYAAFVRSVDPDLPLRLMAYRHHGVRAKGRAWPETSQVVVEEVAELLRSHGLTNVRTPSGD
jgi:pyruvate formate lyase activating enzyme